MVGIMVHIWFAVLICNKTINDEYHECACSIIMFTLHYKLLQRHTIVIHMYIPLHTITKTTIHNQITSCKQGGFLRILGHPLISRIVSKYYSILIRSYFQKTDSYEINFCKCWCFTFLKESLSYGMWYIVVTDLHHWHVAHNNLVTLVRRQRVSYALLVRVLGTLRQGVNLMPLQNVIYHIVRWVRSMPNFHIRPHKFNFDGQPWNSWAGFAWPPPFE